MYCSLRTLLVIYVFGGLTFIPLLVAAVFAFIYYTSPLAQPYSPADALKQDNEDAVPESPSDQELKDDDELEGVDAHKVGWLQVSREYDSSIGLIGPEKIPGNHRGKYMDKMRSLLDRQDTLGPNNTGFLKVKAAMFYAVLKHGNLFLYETEEQVDVKHVIVLQHYVTCVWPIHADDNALFLKPNAICLSRKDAENGLLAPKTESERRNSGSEPPAKRKPPQHSYFLFPTTNVEKEDWYFALLRGSKTTSGSTKNLSPTDPTIAAVPAHFEPAHMFSLIQAIHSSDAQLQTRWLNALIGRIFLGTYQTKHMEEHMINKITKKIARINKPAFLSDIKVQRVHPGTQAPIFTQPRLKELSAAGELAAEINVNYNGSFRIEIATVATLQLGTRFKPRQVNLSMAVTIKKLEGKLLIRIKKPPSNRLWFGFYETPNMDLAIEPIVSSRQITYTMVLRAIESRIRDAIEESVVLPNMDDVAFLETDGEFYRGGIWQRKDDEPVPEPADPASIGDVDAVQKQMEEEANGEIVSKDDSAEHSKSTDSVHKLKPRERLKERLRTHGKTVAIPTTASESNLKNRIGRSSSFTSVASAPAVVATELVNVAGTSPTRDTTDWAAEAAARAIAARSRLGDSPKLSADGSSDNSGSRPLSIKSASSGEGISPVDGEKGIIDAEIPHLSLQDRSASAPPDTSPVEGPVLSKEVRTSSILEPTKRTATITYDKNAALSTRVTQATGVAREMLKTRLDSYLARRQQQKLEKQILTKERDLLVNSTKPRTRLPSDSSPNLVIKTVEDDIDSGPLPFENKKSPMFAAADFGGQSPGYGPSAMMTIPSTMANARRPSASTPEVSPSPAPELPPRLSASPAKRPVPPPPLPARSSPRPIPRRPVAAQPETTTSTDSSAHTPEVPVEAYQGLANKDDHNDDDDLMILHIPSDDEEEELDGAKSSAGGTDSSPVESPVLRRKASVEEPAVLAPSSYGSNKSRRTSVADESAPQWTEKPPAERDMPELMEQGLMG